MNSRLKNVLVILTAVLVVGLIGGLEQYWQVNDFEFSSDAH